MLKKKNLFWRLTLLSVCAALCLPLLPMLNALAADENIALGQRAVACHTESASLGAEKAVDGKESTRFAAGGGCTNDTWYILDLGDIYDVTRVNILWETAHPTKYVLSLSDDGVAYARIATVNVSEGGTVRVGTDVSGTGRFLRIDEKSRSAPAYGFSIFELEVYGMKNATKTNTDEYVTVTVDDSNYGKVSASPVGFVKKGESVTVTLEPSDGCGVVSLTVNGNAVTPDGLTASFIADTDVTVRAVFSQGRKSRFECEDVPVYADINLSGKVNPVRGSDPDASGGYVAGSTGGKWFLFENVCEANCVRIAYASPNTNVMKLAIRYPGDDAFTQVGTIPFSTSNSWYMNSSYTASSGIICIPAGSDILVSPGVDCNLDYLYLTNSMPDAVPDGHTVTASAVSDAAIEDSVSPFGKVLRLTGETKIGITVPTAQDSYNVFNLTVDCEGGGRFVLEKNGVPVGSGRLPDTKYRTYTGTGIRIDTVAAGDKLTLTLIPDRDEVRLSHVCFNRADEPETVTVPAMPAAGDRLTVSLDGIWAVTAEPFGTWDVPAAVPDIDFINSIPVPGLWHSASFDLGTYTSRKMWYEKTVVLEEEPTGRVLLDIGSAQYGRYIYVNGQYVGEYVYNYSRSLTDLTGYLHKGTNTVTVMLGDWAQQINDKTTDAHVLNDGESTTNKPGITDSVYLIFCESPDVVSVQTAQNTDNGTVTAQTVLSNRSDAPVTTDVVFTVYELGIFKNRMPDRAERKVGETVVTGQTVLPGQSLTVTSPEISIADWSDDKRWTPDSPFLYRVEVRTAGDVFSVRFGMRTFTFDGLGNARLNGDIICLMGTNVAIERFFDDKLCLENPWDQDWIEKLYTEYKECHWFCFRTHLGSANSKWFDLADEMGFMIFDEYANWGDTDGCTVRSVMPEIYTWIDTRGHHPSLIVFDAMNEGGGTLSDSIIPLGREYDIQHRPWDNGWNRPVGERDSIECHPYVMGGRGISALQDFDNSKPLVTTADIGWKAEQFASHPFILNEHGELWISREGQAMSGTTGFWNSLRANTSNEARNVYYADAMAAEIECFRAGRAYTGILFFCGLGSSPAGAVGVTSDILSPDVSTPETLQIRPYIKQRLSDAFSPLGICLDYYTESQRRGGTLKLPVVLINDTASPIDNLEIILTVSAVGDDAEPVILYADRKTVSVPVHTETDGGTAGVTFSLKVPSYKEYCKNGRELTVTASYSLDGRTVSSVRKWIVSSGPLTDGELPAYDWLKPQTETDTESESGPEPGEITDITEAGTADTQDPESDTRLENGDGSESEKHTAVGTPSDEPGTDLPASRGCGSVIPSVVMAVLTGFAALCLICRPYGKRKKRGSK